MSLEGPFSWFACFDPLDFPRFYDLRDRLGSLAIGLGGSIIIYFCHHG